jgi:hypothetical protein
MKISVLLEIPGISHVSIIMKVADSVPHAEKEPVGWRKFFIVWNMDMGK